jgi:hypothetical protein
MPASSRSKIVACNPLTVTHSERSINGVANGDMSPHFLDLPRDLRDQVYYILLLHQESIDPWHGYLQEQGLTLGLFRVNKTVHHEATSLFYAQNRFDFYNRTAEQLASFLRQIGLDNADYIRHIFIDFPRFRYTEAGDITLENSSFRILKTIKSSCANLSTLRMPLHVDFMAMEVRFESLSGNNPVLITEALKLVNTRLKAISSLQKIIVEVHERYNHGPIDLLKREMENHGWTISIVESVETDSDSSFSDDDWGMTMAW